MFGGVYLWSGIALTACTLVLFIFTRWHPAPSRALRMVDLTLVTVLGVVMLQLLPLPAAVVRMLSPSRETFVTATSLTPYGNGFSPLTLSAADTAHAALTLVATALTFWMARSLFSRGGIRTFSIVMAWGAIVLSIVAFVQHASGTPLVYGLWQPRDAGARPLGPFINRNHFGTWGIMALCVSAGYLQWRHEQTPVDRGWRSRLTAWMDGRTLVLLLAVVLLAAVIALGASRSAMVALACAAGYVAIAAARGRSRGRQYLPLAFAGLFAIAAILSYGDAERLLIRLDETREAGLASRAAIWRDSVPMVRHYLLTGTGAGTFETAMRMYQTTPRTYYHNEAHNQYVQIVAEGGLLLTMPVVIGVIAFGAAARSRLRQRDEPLHWMRVASAGALVGVAIQSLWETGLTLPGNGMFAAALAAMLVHEAAPHGGTGRRPEGRD
jgi:O-antigen ligase